MAAKTGKKKIKVQDLKPKKDAKGGFILSPGDRNPNGPKDHKPQHNPQHGPLGSGH